MIPFFIPVGSSLEEDLIRFGLPHTPRPCRPPSLPDNAATPTPPRKVPPAETGRVQNLVGRDDRRAGARTGMARVHRKANGAPPGNMAADLDVAIKEDAQGNVISVNTAANRSWVDNYQMEEILAFPRLTSLVVEGPSIDNVAGSQDR